MYGVKVGYWDVNGAICGCDERASERVRASKQVRARTPARYQSPALKAALERILNRERARASEHGEGHANAPRYQRPWTRFTSLFEPYRTCPYCRATRTSFAAVPAVPAGIGTQMRELFAETYKYRDVYTDRRNQWSTYRKKIAIENWPSQHFTALKSCMY